MMGLSRKCYMPSLVEIGQQVPMKKISKVFTIYVHDTHLANVTNIILINFHFFVPIIIYLYFMRLTY